MVSLTKEQAREFAELFMDYSMRDNRGLSLKSMYSCISDYKELAKEFGIDTDDANNLTIVIKWKKRVREEMKREQARREERRIVKEYTDGYVELVRLGEFDSEEEADDYFMRHEYKECPNSQYDCTGKLFTSWYHIFKRYGVYYAYHSVSLDV